MNINRREFFGVSAGLLAGVGVASKVELPPQKAELPPKKNKFIEWAENNIKVYDHNPTPWTLVDFKATEHQKEVANLFETQNRLVVKKYRQGGFSTLAALWSVYECSTKPHQMHVFISTMDRFAMGYCDNTKRILNQMKNPLETEIENFNYHRIKFKNGSQVVFLAPWNLKNNQMPYDNDCVIYDEAAFIKDMRVIHRNIASNPFGNKKGKIFAISTPNGTKNNWFYDTCMSAECRTSEWYSYSPMWHEHPYYQNPDTVEMLKKNLGKKGWRQEVLAEFI